MARPKYYSEDRKYIPYTKSTYIRSPYSGKWILKNREKGLTSRAIVKSEMKAKVVLPFEDRHRKVKKHRYDHDYPYDEITSYKDNMKSVMEFDFKQGDKNYRKLANKSYYDRQRYLKKKKNK